MIGRAQRSVVKSFVLAIAAIVIAGPFQTKQTTAEPFCQGQYSRKNASAGAANAWIPTDRWRMYSMPDGSYSVQAELEPFDKESSVRQTFMLANDLKPKGFSSNSKSGNISCEFNTASLQCSIHITIPNDLTASASLAQTIPYMFMPVADAFPLDLAWFFHMSASQTDRKVGRIIKMPVISIRDGESKDEIKLGIAAWEQIEYLGLEKITILSREISAHKFRLNDAEKPNAENLIQIWTSESGIVLQISNSEENPSILLTEYEGPAL
jgi:hypothetical protein